MSKDSFDKEATKRGYVILTSESDYVLQDCLGRRQSIVTIAVKGAALLKQRSFRPHAGSNPVGSV